jgi:hypothetical protein
MHEELNELGNAMSLMEKIMTSLISDRPRLAVFPLHTIRSGNGAPRIQGLRDDGAPLPLRIVCSGNTASLGLSLIKLVMIFSIKDMALPSSFNSSCIL